MYILKQKLSQLILKLEKDECYVKLLILNDYVITLNSYCEILFEGNNCLPRARHYPRCSTKFIQCLEESHNITTIYM